MRGLFSGIFNVRRGFSELMANSSNPSLTLNDLEPNTSYLIRVQAVDANNKMGRSSSPLSLKTKTEDAEIGQVRNLRVQVIGSDSAQIDWDAPVVIVPKSLRYKFFYRRLNTGKEEEEIQSVVSLSSIYANDRKYG